MEKLVMASVRKSAGKTSAIIGMAKSLKGKAGYMKPFGDRLLYRKKRLWDYDAALATNVLGLDQDPENITIGFEHSKLRYMYDEKAVKDKLVDIAESASAGKDMLFVEGGRDLPYGVSVGLDAISVARSIDGKVLVVVSGDPESVIDDATFLDKYVNAKGARLAGVLVNNVQDVEDFKGTHLPRIEGMGIPVIGVLPHLPKLSRFSVSYLADRLFAKIITGEGNLNRPVESIFIGAMSATAALQNPQFKRGGKLIITSGDRSDMILAALETETAAVIITNNVLPASSIISKATECNVPLLVVPGDTYGTAKQIEGMEPLLTKDDSDKIDVLAQTVKNCVDIKALL
jgi:hypothetical protein